MKYILTIIVFLIGFTSFTQSYIKSTVVGNFTLGSCNNTVVIEAYNMPPMSNIIEDISAVQLDTLYHGDTLYNICLEANNSPNVHRIGFITTNGYTGHAGRLHSTPIMPNFEFDVIDYVEPTGSFYEPPTADGSLTLEFDSSFVLGPNYSMMVFQENGNLTNITYPTANSVTFNDASYGYMTLYIQNDLVPEDFMDIRFIFGDPNDIYMDTGLVVGLSMQHADNNCTGWINATPVNATGNLNNNWSTGDYGTNTLYNLCPGLYGVYSYETDVQTAELIGASIDTFVVTNGTTAYIDSAIYQNVPQDTSYFNFENCEFDYTAPIDTLAYTEDTVYQGGGVTILAFEMNIQQGNTFFTVEDTLTLLNDSIIQMDVTFWCDSTIGLNKANSFNGRRMVYLRGADEHSFSQGTASLIEKVEPMVGAYPNPANDFVTIYSEHIDNAQVHLYDLKGSILRSSAMDSSEMQLDVRDLPSGMYVIQVSNDSWSSRIKFLKN